ncbi:MAG: biotin-dependent carboxyltransferase family protein [Rhodocyclaceae bacterium]|nr:biotin-dependent carboxyltransferase family protein [Rhodocyclaceae bacterium]
MSTLEIRAPGALSSIQDAGRRGYRRIGVPWAGALAPQLMRIANRLVGNDEGAPVIECFGGGLSLAVREGSARIALTGDADARLLRDGEATPLAPWRSITLVAGDELRVLGSGRDRAVTLAVAGLECPPQMGSAATYARAGLGGLDGQPLQAGARLNAADAAGKAEMVLRKPPERDDEAPIRIVAGPQADHFDDAALGRFAGSDYRITAEADRMGMRLDGAALAHRDAGSREIISDATVPGSIQVPGNGLPIVLLADGQTAGGYPKIATVVSADLPRLALRRPGDRVRFELVTVSEAESLARAAETLSRTLLAGIAPLAEDGIDLEALYTGNLIGGMVNALSPD